MQPSACGLFYTSKIAARVEVFSRCWKHYAAPSLITYQQYSFRSDAGYGNEKIGEHQQERVHLFT